VAKLTAAQFEAATKGRYGLTPRPPKSVVPSITRRDYAYVLARWAAFDRWHAWRDVGGPRPAGVWKVVPKWDLTYTPFELLADIRRRWPLHGTKPIETPAPPLPAHSLALGQSWFVIAQDYRESFVGPDYFGRAFTADPGYPHPSRAEVAALRDRGIRTAVWGDSRIEGDGTSPDAIVELANELRVDRPMFQAELERECRAALAKMDQLGGVGHLLIVHLDGIAGDAKLYADLEARINDGRVIAIEESYRNCGWGPVSYHGLPIAGTLAATYGDGDCTTCTLEQLDAWGFAAHRDSYYCAQWHADHYRAAR